MSTTIDRRENRGLDLPPVNNTLRASLHTFNRLPDFQPFDEVLHWEMRWPLVFMVLFHCQWV